MDIRIQFVSQDVLDIESPFSFYFIDQIDNQLNEDRNDSETNGLYDYVIEDQLKDFKNNLHIVNSFQSRNGETILVSILKLLIDADKVH
uniref:Uncharacterized protein n=1 Tax=Rhizophagus irregularis (strain DAOM 181602 / DAOM 197198 / MUCL 43194) TaxID=747089 RepID=U9SR13_RHIID